MTSLNNIEIFTNNKATLKETSKSNHNGSATYMTESILNVVNFDAVKLEYVRDLSVFETPASNDALFFDNFDNCYFIEFKSGYIDRKKTFEIRLKIFDSLLIFTDIVGSGVSFTRNKMSYILVYNEGKNPLPEGMACGMQVSLSRESIAKYIIERRAKKKYIRFNLERFEGLYFKDVYTYTEDDFESEFVSKYFCNHQE